MQSTDDYFQNRINEGRDAYARLSLARLLQNHHAGLEAREQRDNNFSWALLRFSENGQLQNILDIVGYTIDEADNELSQLLASSSESYQFQLLVRKVGHRSPITATEIEILNSIFHISEAVWGNVLVNSCHSRNTTRRDVFEDYGMPSFEADALCIAGNYLCIPGNVSMDFRKTVILFLCEANAPVSNWWLGDSMDSPNGGLPNGHFKVLMGVYGMLKWISHQAKYRACSTLADFAFLCAEALLRAELQTLTMHLVSFRDFMENTRSNGDRPWTSDWLRLDMRVVAIRNAIDLLASWLKDHVHSKEHSQEDFMAKRMARYTYSTEACERLLQVCRRKIDLDFANLSAMNASESIRETKFSKILTVLAIVYLPVSIASSIFGMNVQELNGQGLQIRWFVITIFITMAALLVCWLVFVLVTSQRSYVKSRHPPVNNYWYPRKSRPWIHRILGIGLSRTRIMYWPTRMQHFLLLSYAHFRDWIYGAK